MHLELHFDDFEPSNGPNSSNSISNLKHLQFNLHKFYANLNNSTTKEDTNKSLDAAGPSLNCAQTDGQKSEIHNLDPEIQLYEKVQKTNFFNFEASTLNKSSECVFSNKDSTCEIALSNSQPISKDHKKHF